MVTLLTNVRWDDRTMLTTAVVWCQSRTGGHINIYPPSLTTGGRVLFLGMDLWVCLSVSLLIFGCRFTSGKDQNVPQWHLYCPGTCLTLTGQISRMWKLRKTKNRLLALTLLQIFRFTSGTKPNIPRWSLHHPTAF